MLALAQTVSGDEPKPPAAKLPRGWGPPTPAERAKAAPRTDLFPPLVFLKPYKTGGETMLHIIKRIAYV